MKNLLTGLFGLVGLASLALLVAGIWAPDSSELAYNLGQTGMLLSLVSLAGLMLALTYPYAES